MLTQFSCRQKVQFTVTGGDGAYIWSSLNTQHVTISQTGLADTRLDRIDRDADHAIAKLAQIKVAMTRNQQMAKTADLMFLPPHKLKIVLYNFETALKDYVELHIAVYAKHLGEVVPFTSCDNLNIELDFTNDIFHVNNLKAEPVAKPLQRNACRLIMLRATTLGSTQLRVSYTFADKVLKDEVTLVVFEKLDILNPVSNEIVLPIGGARSVIYFNGPQKMFNIEAELQRISKYDKQTVSVTEVHNEFTKNKHIFTVLCKRVGETSLTFELFNTLATANYEPYVSKYVTQIFCVKPRFINLYTTEKLRQSCPLKLKNSLMHVKRNNDQLEVGIEVLDAQNRKLMNITSLTLDWEFVQIDDRPGGSGRSVVHKRQSEDEIIAGVAIPFRDYMLTAIPDIQNNYKIKGTVVSYDRNVLKGFGIVPESPEFGIQKVSGMCGTGGVHTHCCFADTIGCCCEAGH